MSLTLLINPMSGGAPDSVAGLTALAEASGAEVHVTRDSAELSARVTALSDDPSARVAIAGGDGTFSTAVNAVMNATSDMESADRALFGLIPIGTANDLAHALEIPTACEDAWFHFANHDEHQHRSTAIDVLRVQAADATRWSVNAIVTSPAVEAFNDALDDDRKMTWGAASYGRTALAAAGSLDPVRYRMNLGRHNTTVACGEVDAFGVVIGNGETAAGGVPIGPPGSLTSGVLEVRVLRETSALSVALTASRMLAGACWDNTPDVSRAQADTIELEPITGPSPTRIDGEMGPDGSLTITVHAGALRVVG